MPRKPAASASQPQTNLTTPKRRGPKPGSKRKSTIGTSYHAGTELPLEQLFEEIFPAPLFGRIAQAMASNPERGSKMADVITTTRNSVDSWFNSLEQMAKNLRPKALGAGA